MSESTRQILIALIGSLTTIVVAALPLYYAFKTLRFQLEQNREQSAKNAAKLESIEQTQRMSAISDEQIRDALAKRNP